MMIRVNKSLTDDEFLIRTEVFTNEQGLIDIPDSIDSYATHLVLYVGNKPIGCCRIFKEDDKYILGRLAILKDYRKKGYGSSLVLKALEIASAEGFSSLHLHSQYRARGFYCTLGFIEYGDIEYEQNVSHIWMKYNFR